MEIDTRPGAYYVSAVDGKKFTLLLGPFIDCHVCALSMVDHVRIVADRVDPKSVFYSFGTCRLLGVAYKPAGVLNSYFPEVLVK